MFWPIPAIIRFSSKRVLVFIRCMRLCNDGEISSSVVLIITTIKRCGWVSLMWVLCWLGVQCSCRCLFSVAAVLCGIPAYCLSIINVLSLMSVSLWVVYAFYPIFLMVILVFSLIAPDCWCVHVYMSSFTGLRSASVTLCAALLFLWEWLALCSSSIKESIRVW